MTRQNPKGGKPLQGFPLREENGYLGYLLGYCSHGEQILVRTIDAREILTHFHIGEQEAKQILKKLTSKPTWRERLIKLLGDSHPVHN